MKKKCKHEWINVGFPTTRARKVKGFLGLPKTIYIGTTSYLKCLKCNAKATYFVSNGTTEEKDEFSIQKMK